MLKSNLIPISLLRHELSNRRDMNVKKPTAKQMRPIALTDVSYKLFMTILGAKIDRYILENNKNMETPAGFTTGSMIEDNLFLLQYCIEGYYKLKRPLIVTCLDYSKAFNSIRRGKIIEALLYYKIHYKIIDVIANIYEFFLKQTYT